jgi:hypothetical protein
VDELNPCIFWLSIIGLAIPITGSFYLYLGTPIDIGFNKPASELKVHWANEQEKIDSENGIKKRERYSKRGFKLLIIGFVVQLFALILQQIFKAP